MINPMVGESRNRLQNCKLIAADVPQDVYRRQEPGIVRGNPKYCMSCSELRQFARCGTRWLNGYQEPQSDARDWGNMLDAMISEQFGALFAVCPAEYRNKKGELKPWRFGADVTDAWKAEQEAAGKTIAKQDEAAQAMTAAKILTQDPLTGPFLADAQRQVMVIGEWEDPETGLIVPLKGLIDVVPSLEGAYPKSLGDLKTGRNGSMSEYVDDVARYGYHAQGALYLDLYTKATKEDRLDFRHIYQESYPPYQVGRRFLTTETLEYGRLKYQVWLQLYAAAVTSGKWPDYDSGHKCIDGGWAPCEFTKPWQME